MTHRPTTWPAAAPAASRLALMALMASGVSPRQEAAPAARRPAHEAARRVLHPAAAAVALP